MSSKIVFTLYGPFDVADEAGVSLRPRTLKDCALLAILASSPNFKRSRSWLKSVLWADRAEAQASASLRQSIWALKKKLNASFPVIFSDRQNVWLHNAEDRISIRSSDAAQIFLEGIDIKSEGFEDWLRERRSTLEITDPTHIVRGGSDIPPEFNTAAAVIGVLPVRNFSRVDEDDARVNYLLNQIISDIHSHGQIEVFDFRTLNPDPNMTSINCQINALLSIDVIRSHDSVQLTISIQDPSNGYVLKSISQEWNKHPSALERQERLMLLANHAVDVIHNCLCQRSLRVNARPSLLTSVHKFFSNSVDQRLQARSEFSQWAESSGVANAWLAYSYVVGSAEAHEKASLEQIEKVIFHCARAIELDPTSPVVQSIVGHVYAFAFRNIEKSEEHFNIARELGSNLALVWSLLSLQSNYSGRYSLALDQARKANSLSRFSPYRFLFDAGLLFSSTLSGKHDHAIELGKSLLVRSPGFLGAMRHLVASYALTDRVPEAREMILEIQKRDERFNVCDIEDEAYPLPSTRSLELVRNAFEITGMR